MGILSVGHGIRVAARCRDFASRMLAGVPSRGAITYAGHATVLIEMGEARLLTDPLLRERLLVVLRRHGGVGRDALGRVDGVLISHLHLDHLDLASLRKIGRSVPILAPPRSAGLLARHGFANVTELSPGRRGRWPGWTCGRWRRGTAEGASSGSARAGSSAMSSRGRAGSTGRATRRSSMGCGTWPTDLDVAAAADLGMGPDAGARSPRSRGSGEGARDAAAAVRGAGALGNAGAARRQARSGPGCSSGRRASSWSGRGGLRPRSRFACSKPGQSLRLDEPDRSDWPLTRRRAGCPRSSYPPGRPWPAIGQP